MLSFIHKRSRTVASAAFLIASAGLTSRLLGLVRERLIAGLFGASDTSDIYYASFVLPDFFFAILILGAISAAFIPVLAEKIAQSQKKKFSFEQNSPALILTNNVLNVFTAIMGLLSLILFAFAPEFVRIIAPGFAPAKQLLTVTLTRIMLLQPILLTIASIAGGVLQVFRRFIAFALAPIFYNLGLITGIVYFYPKFGITGLGWGVVLGALFNLCVQLPSFFKSGFSYSWRFNLRDKALRKIIKLMLPRTFGLAASKINIAVITALASTLAPGSIAIFNWANHIQYVPIGIIGISFSVAAFPFMALSFSKKRMGQYLRYFSESFQQIIFWTLPLSVLFFVLRAQIVRIILGTGRFSWQDTRLTAACLGIFSLAIVVQSLVPVLAKAFYALQNTKVPVVATVLATAVNIILSFTFVFALRLGFISRLLNVEDLPNTSVLALPLAFAFAAVFQFFLLFAAFSKYLNRQILKEILIETGKISFAALSLGAVSYFALRLFEKFAHIPQTTLGLLIQSGLSALAGILVLLGLCRILRVKEFEKLFKALTFRPR